MKEFQNPAPGVSAAVHGSANGPARIRVPTKNDAWLQEASVARLARFLTEDVAATSCRLEN